MTDLREVLILTLALLIVFSLLRALYVIHRRRKGQIRLNIEKNVIQELEGEAPEFSELPNGGARVVANSETTAGAVAADAPEQSHAEDLEFGEVSITAGERIGMELPQPAESQPALERKPESGPEPELAAESEPETQLEPAPEGELELDSNPASEPESEPESNLAPDPEPERQPEPEPQTEVESESEADSFSADRIIAIYVLADEDREFNGRELWDFLHAAGLRHDEMKVFSKTESNREDGQAIFRVANIVDPGTFDADAIDEFTTPGVGMFMLLPAPINNLLAFEQMLAVARRLAETLDGHLLDHEHQAMTAQRIEQARRRIREFDMETAASPSVSNGM